MSCSFFFREGKVVLDYYEIGYGVFLFVFLHIMYKRLTLHIAAIRHSLMNTLCGTPSHIEVCVVCIINTCSKYTEQFIFFKFTIIVMVQNC